jgi:hypothetical protein
MKLTLILTLVLFAAHAFAAQSFAATPAGPAI